MSKKRLFQILDEMKVDDAANKTHNVSIHPDIVRVDSMKKGLKITMGAPHEATTINKLMNGDKIPILLIIDSKEYNKYLTN